MKRVFPFIALLLSAPLATPAYGQVAISQLPSATTPLAGTEIVPIVQSGVTKNVSVANIQQPILTNLAATTGAAKVGVNDGNGGTLFTTVQGGVTYLLSNIPVSHTQVFNETPSGSINGTNVTFTLSHTPYNGQVMLYYNGVLQELGSGNDYTLSGATVTMAVAPPTYSKIRAYYSY